MENEGRRPGPVSPAEARDALRDADEAARGSSRRTLPGWYFPAMSVPVGALLLTQMLHGWARTFAMLAVLAVVLLVSALAQHVAGVAWRNHRLEGQVPFLVRVIGVIAVTAVAVALTGLSWLWAVGAVPAAGVVLLTGVGYQRLEEHR